MISFTEWLNIKEGSRWKQSSWKPLPKDTLTRLKLYNKPIYYCSFSYLEYKLGVNPQPFASTTPYGIYTYPVQYVIKQGIANIPFASERPYIHVLKAKNPRRIRKIETPFDKNAMLWEEAKRQSYTLGLFHAYLLKRNVEGFVDNGTGTIHPNEPTQAVFFGSQTIIPVDVFKNTEGEAVTDDYYSIKTLNKIEPIKLPDLTTIKIKDIEDELKTIDYHLQRWDITSLQKNQLKIRKTNLEDELNRLVA